MGSSLGIYIIILHLQIKSRGLDKDNDFLKTTQLVSDKVMTGNQFSLIPESEFLTATQVAGSMRECVIESHKCYINRQQSNR